MRNIVSTHVRKNRGRGVSTLLGLPGGLHVILAAASIPDRSRIRAEIFLAGPFGKVSAMGTDAPKSFLNDYGVDIYSRLTRISGGCRVQLKKKQRPQYWGRAFTITQNRA